MDNIVIDKNISIPRHWRSKYPWREMEVGDSFVVLKLTISIGAANKRYPPRKFTKRKVEGGYRVWRVE